METQCSSVPTHPLSPTWNVERSAVCTYCTVHTAASGYTPSPIRAVAAAATARDGYLSDRLPPTLAHCFHPPPLPDLASSPASSSSSCSAPSSSSSDLQLSQNVLTDFLFSAAFPFDFIFSLFSFFSFFFFFPLFLLIPPRPRCFPFSHREKNHQHSRSRN